MAVTIVTKTSAPIPNETANATLWEEPLEAGQSTWAYIGIENGNPASTNVAIAGKQSNTEPAVFISICTYVSVEQLYAR